jgi:hypothetical protein
MTLSIAACSNTADDTSKVSNDTSAKAVEIKSFSDVMSLAEDYSVGTYGITSAVNSNYNSSLICASGEANGNDMTVDNVVVVSGDNSTLFANLLTACDDKIYINFDSIFNALGNDTYDLGYYGLDKLVDDSEYAAARSDITAFLGEFADAATKDCGLTIDGNKVSVTVEDSEDIKSLITNAIDFIIDNEDDIKTYQEKYGSLIDFSACASLLLDGVYDDFASAYTELTDDDFTTECPKDTLQYWIDSYIDNLTYGDIDDILAQLEVQKEEMANWTDEDWDERLSAQDGATYEFGAEATGDSFLFNIEVTFISDETPVSMALNITFDKGDVEISAPENVSSASDMAEYMAAHPDKFQSISDLLLNGMSYNNIEFGSDDWTYDYDDYSEYDEYVEVSPAE